MRIGTTIAVSFAVVCGGGSCRLAQAQRTPDDLERIKDVEYGKGGSVSLKLDVIQLKQPKHGAMPAVIFIHGGGWSKGDKNFTVPGMVELAREGFKVFTIDYRLTDVAQFPAQIEDCKAAVRWVRANAKKYDVNSDKIGVYGVSAGGHLSALLGTSGGVAALEGKGGNAEVSSGVQAVLDSCGPSDLTGAAIRFSQPVRALLGVGPKAAELAKLASPVTHASKDDPPFMIVQGADDKLVNPEQSRKLEAALREAGVPVELKIIPGMGHGLRYPEAGRDIVAFFKKTLMNGILRSQQAGREPCRTPFRPQHWRLG